MPVNRPKYHGETLNLTIRNRQEVLFRDAVSAVTSTNDKGQFDVLPRHAYFIGLIQEYIIIHQKNGQERKIPIMGGVMHVSDNVVNVYLNS